MSEVANSRDATSHHLLGWQSVAGLQQVSEVGTFRATREGCGTYDIIDLNKVRRPLTTRESTADHRLAERRHRPVELLSCSDVVKSSECFKQSASATQTSESVDSVLEGAMKVG